MMLITRTSPHRNTVTIVLDESTAACMLLAASAHYALQASKLHGDAQIDNVTEAQNYRKAYTALRDVFPAHNRV